MRKNNKSKKRFQSGAYSEKAQADTPVAVAAKDITAPDKNKEAEKAGPAVTEAKKPAALDYGSAAGQPGTFFLQDAKERVLSANPVFVKAIAAVPILGAAVSLKGGIMLSGVMFLTVILLNLIMYPLHRLIPRNYRFAAAFVAAGAVITPVYILANYIAPTVTSLCGIYLPLTAVCALPMIEKKYYGRKFGIAKTTLAAAFDGVGFTFAAAVFSIIREIIGSGTLYGRPLPCADLKFSFALLPAGAFLLLGALIALFRKFFGAADNGEGGSK
jgi:Na+-translocating ferredoxin:NAD+ oxidoreductase subunit E